MRRVIPLLALAVVACSGSQPAPVTSPPPASPSGQRGPLWFVDYTGRSISSEVRPVDATVDAILRALADGPRSPDLSGNIPPAQSAVLNGSTARVTFAPPLTDALSRQAVAWSLRRLAATVEIDVAAV